jgi:hypothetical protein
MLDLKVMILTHSASSWDVQKIVNDCRAAFEERQELIDVEVFSNPVIETRPLSNPRYLMSALSAQWVIGSDRLKRHFSISTFSWHIRQLGAYIFSLAKLAQKSHRIKVRVESRRQSIIAGGHELMWQKALLEPSKLYLFLEDDVTLLDREALPEATQALLEMTMFDSLVICDASHSFQLKSLGFGSLAGNSDATQSLPLRFFDFPFTNTLAATFMPRDLLEKLQLILDSGGGLKGLAADADLPRLLVQMVPTPKGCLTQRPVFMQQSEFRSQRI